MASGSFEPQRPQPGAPRGLGAGRCPRSLGSSAAKVGRDAAARDAGARTKASAASCNCGCGGCPGRRGALTNGSPFDHLRTARRQAKEKRSVRAVSCCQSGLAQTRRSSRDSAAAATAGAARAEVRFVSASRMRAAKAAHRVPRAQDLAPCSATRWAKSQRVGSPSPDSRSGTAAPRRGAGAVMRSSGSSNGSSSGSSSGSASTAAAPQARRSKTTRARREALPRCAAKLRCSNEDCLREALLTDRANDALPRTDSLPEEPFRRARWP
mmetsp:Transcript_76262/g.213890  ORF Transcript_76262/g.213890 Transcript_76262/m.213890 type:complete len:268 (+) Transcript_76262:1030-1833(+)